MTRAPNDGRTSHPLYPTWNTIKTRCYNQNSRGFQFYGARGIKMFEEWRDDATAFLSWVDENLGPRPDGSTLDRIDCDGDYAPGNLRWASRSEQSRNRRMRRDNTSGFIGAYEHRGRWASYRMIDGTRYFLGTFDTPEEAAAAFDRAAGVLE